ncbi:hypothetical protein PROCH_0816 [Prochlorococcus marinus str. EQPAC1]|nr:hypothetical protein PROCH_0816 [Prochlorococcus marinus str. EQPAC1]
MFTKNSNIKNKNYLNFNPFLILKKEIDNSGFCIFNSLNFKLFPF